MVARGGEGEREREGIIAYRHAYHSSNIKALI
jgi:hypothetical protein